jgi:Phospholipase_D-nuclease N-terminal
MHLGFIGLGILELFLVLFLAPLALLTFAFWIWMLVHAITNDGLTDIEKLIWVIVILFTHFIGAIIYFFVGRPKRRTAL